MTRSKLFILFCIAALAISANTNRFTPAPAAKPKIQAAILLDVSGSMDGLIQQAKTQLWNMVSVMGKAQCNGVTPDIEIALYEYGRDTNDPAKGYIRQISPFTTDLDTLSTLLFALNTNGGSEFCGYVIKTALDDLKWDASRTSYKTIFIAGNEDFLQGSINYTSACQIAQQKGVIVNTIYCGDRLQGIREHWDLSNCGGGSFTNINQNVVAEDIPTPYDSTLITLNNSLNGTYLAYGRIGAERAVQQAKMDQANSELSMGAGLQRIAVKGNGALYRNDSWDLVDASKSDSSFIDKLDIKTLPDSLRIKTREQLRQLVEVKNNERGVIRNEITKLSQQREVYLVNERKKRAAQNNAVTLETEVEKTIRVQALKYNMVIQ